MQITSSLCNDWNNETFHKNSSNSEIATIVLNLQALHDQRQREIMQTDLDSLTHKLVEADIQQDL